ncbi:MAG TPA: hypothetical protein VLF14_09400, partial [Candidatus Binatia bacterium]|nr:hypothetical protein [Candidatus Binatia bacterium]
PELPGNFAVDAPSGWDGTLDASYVIPLARSGSRAEQAHGLLPRSDDSHAAGFSSNTLIDVIQGARRLEAERTIRFVGPPDATIATGWGGLSTGAQEVRFDHAIDNVPLVFGHLSAVSTSDAGGLRFEIAQFGPGPDGTGHALRIAETLVPLYGRNSGRPYGEPVRLFLTPLTRGGTHTDHGCIVGFQADDLDAENVPEFIRIVAHELFHNWLGGCLRPPDDESLVWFHEGFTEYFTTWHMTASSLASREWFAERLASMDAVARSSSAFGRVTFAEPSVRWRDGDGPNETLAYRGGAMLAFFADVELRRQGGPGLMKLVADLLRDGDRPLTLVAIREWMGSNGLAEFYASYVAKPASLPDLDSALREIGFEATESEASLTYLGIEIEGSDSIGKIAALDPDGPAARAGFKIGDQIVGCAPSRMNPPRVGASVATPYRFGLNRLASGAKVGTLDVVRDGRELTLSIEPRPIPGGLRTAYRRGGEALDRFFQ